VDLAALQRFHAVWGIDFEFCQPEGERPRPLCLSARDLLTGRRLDLDGSQLRQGHPPFDVANSVFVAYAARAEMSCFAALEWPMPEYIVDLHIEYIHYHNDGRYHPRKLLDALDDFGLPHIDAEDKEDMRAIAMRGHPTSEEMRALQAYCATDTEALAYLLPAMAPHIDLIYALVRGRFTGAVGRMEHVGVPYDTALLARLHERWPDIKQVFMAKMQREWDLFDGERLRARKFQAFVEALHLPYWPRTPAGHYSRDKDVLRDMAAIYGTSRPQIQRLKEVMDFWGQVKTLQLPVGQDGYSRTPLWPNSTKTGRCAPSTTKFVFNLPAWLRCGIQPPPGQALALLDYRQEEPAIAACLSEDPAMMAGYTVGGDLYLDLAQRAGAIPAHERLTAGTLPALKRRYTAVRDRYKICLLAAMYGQQATALAGHLGQAPIYAAALLRQLAHAYPRFTQWIDNEIDVALLQGHMTTPLGWRLRTHRHTRETSLLNYPMQAMGAAILQRAVSFVQRAGVHVCAPVHDALLIQAPVEDIRHHAWLAKEAMQQASRDLLGGFTIQVDGWGEHAADEVIVWPQHYTDGRGRAMWAELVPILGVSPFAGLEASRITPPRQGALVSP
jgi:DNA polymerase-1